MRWLCLIPVLAGCSVGVEPTRSDEYLSCTTVHGGIGTCRDERAECRKVLLVADDFTCRDPCIEDEDCPASGERTVTCERYRHGAYCTVRCEDNDCPEGTRCITSHLLAGREVKLCL